MHAILLHKINAGLSNLLVLRGNIKRTTNYLAAPQIEPCQGRCSSNLQTNSQHKSAMGLPTSLLKTWHALFLRIVNLSQWEAGCKVAKWRFQWQVYIDLIIAAALPTLHFLWCWQFGRGAPGLAYGDFMMGVGHEGIKTWRHLPHSSPPPHPTRPPHPTTLLPHPHDTHRFPSYPILVYM